MAKIKKPVIITAAVIAAAGLVVIALLVVKPAINDNGTDGNGVIRDTRLTQTQKATSDADTQSANGDNTAAYATLDATIAKTDSTNVEDLVSLYETKAAIATNANQKDIAVAAQEKAIALRPDDYKLVEGLGDIYQYLGDGQNAAAQYAKAQAMVEKSDVRSEHGVGGAQGGGQ